MIKITDQPINTNEILAYTSDPQAGGIDVFIGTVRDKSFGKAVTKLEYEAYDTMAIKEMQKLCDTASQKWPIVKYAIVHRKGALQIGDIAVVIAVSTPHRAAAFEACQWLIDNLKVTVPIWKKEFYLDGDVWVAAHA